MKKYLVFGLLTLSSLVLVSCGNSNRDSSETIDSLKKENTKLKAENSELSERVTNFESIFSTASSSESDSSNATSDFKIGEPASFSSNEIVTVTEVKADDSISLNDPKDGEHPVVVTAIIENSSNNVIDFNAQTFALYDGNSELANFDASTYGNNIPHEIAGGKKATIVMHFSAKGNAPYSVTYGPATWNQ